MGKWLSVVIAVAVITVGGSAPSFGQKAPAPRGEVRIVDPSTLNWARITWNIFEHLIEVDPDGKLPIRLYAVNKAVEFVPYSSMLLQVSEMSVSAQHWSVRRPARPK